MLSVNAEMQEAIYKTIIEVLEKILSDVYIYLTINARPLGFYALYHCSSYCPRIIKLYRSCHKMQIFGPWILYLINYSFIYNYVLGNILTIKKYMNCKKITLMKIYIIKFTIFYSFASNNWKDHISKSRVQTEK